jgi:hypothetical protein
VRVAAVSAAGVQLVWDEPPPVLIPHRYSDEVAYYLVFRKLAGALDFVPLGRSSSRSYTDAAVQSGRTYEYVVSSVRVQDAEGSRSDPPAVARIP